MKLAISKGSVDVVSVIESGWTPIHFAADSGHLSVLEMLVGAKADLEVKALAWSPVPVCRYTPHSIPVEGIPIFRVPVRKTPFKTDFKRTELERKYRFSRCTGNSDQFQIQNSVNSFNVPPKCRIAIVPKFRLNFVKFNSGEINIFDKG